LVLHQLKKLSLDFFSYDKLRNEFDSGSFADNKENFSNSEQYRGFSPKYKYNKGEIVLNSSKFDQRALLILVVFILQIKKCECRCIQ
jgi:hypothetical protein